MKPKAHSGTLLRPCAVSHTAYTYAHSSSYSCSVLEFEHEHRITPVVEAPRMSRRSLRLHTTADHYGDDRLLDRHSASYCAGGSREDRPLKSRRAHHSVAGSQSLMLTPQKSHPAPLAPLNSSLHSCAASDASLLSSMLDESCIQERTLMDSFWGLDGDGDHGDRTILASGDALTAQTQTSVVNGYTCKDCSFPKHSFSTACPSKPSSSSAAQKHTTLNTAPHATTVYSRDKPRKHRPADWRYCGNMKVEEHPKQDGHRDASASLSQGSSSVWQRLLTLMSLLRDFLFVRCLPNLHRLLLLLIPLLLLMVLCYWGPSALWAVLPAVNITDWRVESLLGSALWETPLEEQTSAVPYAQPPLPDGESQPSSSPPSLDPDRRWNVEHIERSLAQLGERVTQGEKRNREQSAQLLALYRPLQEQLETGTHLRQLEQWAMGMMEDKMQPVKEEVERSTRDVKQQQQQYVSQQQSYQTRVANLEALLEALAQKTEEVQKAQETTLAPVSEVVDYVSHETLLLEVQRLEAALGSIRADLQGVKGCQGRCGQLENIQNMVSAQVKQELQALFYGAEADGGTLPDSLLPWLAARFVNGSDLQASLAALEQSILGNVSRLVEQSEQKRQSVRAETLTQSIRHSTSQTGLSEEHVELIVKNALSLYSQDRTGMVDYALESGGGSILSTRCSETFETKTALMSLFGLPLWYFSQSPRVIIQPDVHPGNCWAFKGSHGYLVIRLSMRVVPMAFSLEHIPKSLSPTGHITSAPRDYTVYGLEDEQQEEGRLLGRYTYDEDGDALQTHPVTESSEQAFQIIEMRVLSNWGHSDYTCLYRFRVHGRPAPY
ncbi:SUN domain-containing protein 1 isoform X3 [Clupea harengus]|uniref:SUN domain-containing protein 1 isoform X3 n=1 Tax=Clupea harengus TaxID=7950 RepID=A0A8M1K9Y5_CLUHA|nr:SUN domain-containing protein 1 isoform X3 [Clupea harengus]